MTKLQGMRMNDYGQKKVIASTCARGGQLVRRICSTRSMIRPGLPGVQRARCTWRPLGGRRLARCLTGVEALSHLFADVAEMRSAASLNACSTDEHAVAISEHIEATIGMAASIGDDAAAVFAAAFYRGLASGRSVVGAYEQGIAAMMVERTGDEDVPKLHARPGADLDRLVLATARH